MTPSEVKILIRSIAAVNDGAHVFFGCMHEPVFPRLVVFAGEWEPVVV